MLEGSDTKTNKIHLSLEWNYNRGFELECILPPTHSRPGYLVRSLGAPEEKNLKISAGHSPGPFLVRVTFLSLAGEFIIYINWYKYISLSVSPSLSPSPSPSFSKNISIPAISADFLYELFCREKKKNSAKKTHFPKKKTKKKKKIAAGRTRPGRPLIFFELTYTKAQVW